MAWYVESKYDQMRASKTALEVKKPEPVSKKDVQFKKEEAQREEEEEMRNTWNDGTEEERISDLLDVKNM